MEEEDANLSAKVEKDQAAVSLCRKGGLARRAALTKERRSEIARNASRERWRRVKEQKESEDKGLNL